MIVQPTPTNPRSPLRRAMRLGGLLLPVVLLGAVVGAGLLGPRPEPGPDDQATAPPAVVPSPAPSTPAPLVAIGTGPAFPAVAADLPVLAIPAARAALEASGGRPLAVAGYLTQVRPPAACPAAAGDTRGLLSPLCERRARLVVADPSALDPDAVSPPAHLHVRVPPGVRLPGPLEDRFPDQPMPVVLVGRAEVPDAPCPTTARGCHDRFVADLVAWADGAPFDPGPVFDAGLALAKPEVAYRRLGEAITLATGWSGTVLVAAVVRPRTVAEIDPVAAAAMAGSPEAEELVWYVRGLETAYDPTRYPLGYAPPRLSWAVIDERTGATLARGVQADADASPATVGGLPVLPVADVLAGRPEVPAGAVVAVSGIIRVSDTTSAACEDAPGGRLGPWCERQAILAEWWSTPTSTLSGPFPPHVHLVVPAGVRLPEAVIAARRTPDGVSRAVVIGRFATQPGECPGEPPGCEQDFIVERLAWVDGVRVGLTPLLAEALQTGTKRANPFALRLEPGELPLSAVVTWPDELARIDPAAGALAAGLPPSEPLTYMRVVEAATSPGGPRGVRWVLLRDTDLGIVASGRTPAPGEAG